MPWPPRLRRGLKLSGPFAPGKMFPKLHGDGHGYVHSFSRTARPAVLRLRLKEQVMYLRDENPSMQRPVSFRRATPARASFAGLCRVPVSESYTLLRSPESPPRRSPSFVALAWRAAAASHGGDRIRFGYCNSAEFASSSSARHILRLATPAARPGNYATHHGRIPCGGRLSGLARAFFRNSLAASRSRVSER